MAGLLAWAAFAPIAAGSRDALFEIPKGTWARRMAGDLVEILPHVVVLTLGVNDTLLLRNKDTVPQVFGPVLIMPGQDFRLPFEPARSTSSPAPRTPAADDGDRRALSRTRPGRACNGGWPCCTLNQSSGRVKIRGKTEKMLPGRRSADRGPGRPVVVSSRPSVIFPTPLQVVDGTLELARDGTLWEHIGASLFRVGAGFMPRGAGGGAAGLVDGPVDGGLQHAQSPIFQILRPISPIAWIPLAILWFGVGDVSPVFLIFIAAVFPMIVQTAAGVHTIEKRYLDAAANFGVSRRKLFRQVVVPAVLPEIVVGMRISLGVAWLVVVAAEMIARAPAWAT
jgi:hypothetical protein